MPESLPRALLRDAVATGICSAAVVRVEDLARRAPLLVEVVGAVSAQPPGPPVREDSRFDLASLTKLVTATTALRLVDRRVLALSDDVAELLGERGGVHAGISVAQLLSHTSGLPAWAPLWEQGDVRAAALAAAPESTPGLVHRYSDLGFLVLASVLERASGQPLAELLHAEVLGPLGMSSTTYRGVRQGEAAALALLATGDVVATERCAERGTLLVGEVSDRNTWYSGGVAPHAGLFGPAADLAAFARGWWDAPQTGYLSAALRDAAWGPPSHPGGHSLGWDTVAAEGSSSAGSLLSRRSHGHLGFSGCSLWVDPERAIAVILLTNRIHPCRDDNRIRALRPAVHDAVASAADRVR